MGHLFDSPKKQEEQQQLTYDQAVLDLKVTRDKMKKYQQRLEKDNEQSIQLAKKLANEGKKDRAKLVIKAKIQREATLKKVDGMLLTVQDQLDKLEQASVNKMVVESLQNTNTVLKKMTEEISVEKVEALMEENAEQNEKLQEITTLLSENMTPEDTQTAEEEYEQMLAQLEEEEENEKPIQQQEDEEPEEAPEKPNRVAALA